MLLQGNSQRRGVTCFKLSRHAARCPLIALRVHLQLLKQTCIIVQCKLVRVDCSATARDGESPVVNQADLLHGAQLQLRGALRMKDFDRRRIPTRGLEAVLLPKELKANLDKIVHHEKVSCRFSRSLCTMQTVLTQ